MFWLILKTLGYVLLALIAWVIYKKMIAGWIFQCRYTKQGVRFNTWWAPIKDGLELGDNLVGEVGVFLMNDSLKNKFLTTEQLQDKDKHTLPPMIGMHVLGQSMLIVQSPELVEEIFGPLGKYVTKEEQIRDLNSFLVVDSIFFKKTEDLDFPKRRKGLSSSLFKNKLLLMMQ